MSFNPFRKRSRRLPLEDRGPLRVMFVITAMPIGGAETLLVELIRRLDRSRFLPELCCLKELGPLGETLALEIPAFTDLLKNKRDVGVLVRLTRLMRKRRIDAVVTVGAGDKMFWGRLAARAAGVPVIASALHSTGFPDRVQFLNRLLAPITDAFIAVAEPHGRYLSAHEGCTASKIVVVPNGVDVDRFRPGPADESLRAEFGFTADMSVAGIVAALRPEKNHAMFLRAAAQVVRINPKARFLIVGDGPRREELESLARELSIADFVRFAGARNDIPQLLSVMDTLVLSSHMEANPVSILEAMASGKPVIATRVGSVEASVLDGKTGYLVAAGAEVDLAHRMAEVLSNRSLALTMGRAGRQHVIEHSSIARMIEGYQEMFSRIYAAKAGKAAFQGPKPQKPGTSDTPSDEAGLGFRHSAR